MPTDVLNYLGMAYLALLTTWVGVVYKAQRDVDRDVRAKIDKFQEMESAAHTDIAVLKTKMTALCKNYERVLVVIETQHKELLGKIEGKRTP